MTAQNIYQKFEAAIAIRMQEECEKMKDPSHDFLHVQRVVKMAKKIALLEGADLNIVVPAAYLHDIVNIPKNDPRRSEASRLSSQEAQRFLQQIGYPDIYLEKIGHAIEAHSFSANIQATSLEAQVVQDADRLDGLGAIGVARCFSVGALFNRSLYTANDSFCETRVADDNNSTLDHFFTKLLKVPDKLHTSSGRKEGQRRAQFLQTYLDQLREELLVEAP